MTNNAMRRAAFLEEMGVGPLWLRRARPAIEQADAGVDAGVDENAEAKASEPALEAGFVLAENAFATPVSMTTPMDHPATHGSKFNASPENDLPANAPWVDEAPLNRDPAVVPDIASMDWDELEATVATCTRCGLCAGRTNTVFGVGDRKARWLFVGEGPGRNEDQSGEPFVGPAGQLLDNMLSAMHLARGQNAYIANVVKCHPTGNDGSDRRPTVAEQGTCQPYLERQIALIQPTVIVALGKTAAASLLGLDPATALQPLLGRVHRYREIPVVATYHPAYLLRKPAEKKQAWADLCLAMAAYARAD